MSERLSGASPKVIPVRFGIDLCAEVLRFSLDKVRKDRMHAG